MRVKLPCGIFKDNEVYDHVTIKELTGKQQNYLMNLELVTDSLGHIPKLISDLTEDYQTKAGKPSEISSEKAVWLLPTEDIEFILVKIREETYGKMYAMKVQCPSCDKIQEKSIDLTSLEVRSIKNKKKRTKEIKLPKSKRKISIKMIYLKDLMDINQLTKEKEGKQEFYTRTIATSVESIDDKKITLEDIENLPLTDLQYIEKELEKLRGYVDNLLQHQCEACKYEFEGPLPVADPSFFGQSPTLLT